jgi:hypothetical protein
METDNKAEILGKFVANVFFRTAFSYWAIFSYNTLLNADLQYDFATISSVFFIFTLTYSIFKK